MNDFKHLTLFTGLSEDEISSYSQEFVEKFKVDFPEDVKEFLNEEELSKVNFKYNLAKEIDSSYKKGDNLGYVDILVGDQLIDTYNVYLEEDIFAQKEQKNIIVTLLFILISGIIFTIFINLLLPRS